MLVPVTYTGPREFLDLSWTTDGLHFERGKATPVPEALLPLLKELPGHGFSIPNAAAPAFEVGAAPVVEPEAEPTPEPDEEPAPAPALKKPGRKAKEA